MNIFIQTLVFWFTLQLQIFYIYSRQIKSSCEEVDKELIAMGVISENLPKGLKKLPLSILDIEFHDANICAQPYGNKDCCSKAIKFELLKRSAHEVNDGYKSYISFCIKELQHLLKNLKRKLINNFIINYLFQILLSSS